MKHLLLLMGSILAVACSSSSSDVGNTNDAQEVAPIDAGSDVPPEASTDSSMPDVAPDAISDVGSDTGTTPMCGPSWKPTVCHDCGGGSSGSTCNQPCMSCDDGHRYRAECDGTSGKCRCFIDDVEKCSCTIHVPIGAAGCEPEAYGGSNCCWNVG